MKIKKYIAACLIAGILGLNFAPTMTLAIGNSNKDKTTVKEKKLTKKEKKAKEKKQSMLDAININWWESQNDEYLKDYIYKALANNQDLKVATLKVEESRQLAKLQLAKEMPQFSVGAAPGLLKLPNTTNTEGAFAIPMIASYEADIFLKNRDKTRSAKKLYEASQYQEKATYIAIASQVGAVYYNIVQLDKLIEIEEEIIRDRKEIFELMRLSNEADIVSTSDLVKAEKALILANTNILELKKNREIMLNSLAVLIGENPNNAHTFKRISFDKIKNIKNIPNEVSSEVITQRPDYLVAQKMIEKAGIDVRVAKKEFLPTFNIIGLLSLNTTSMMPTMNWSSAFTAAGISAMLPLFTGGAKIANLKINKNRYEQAILNYQKTNLTAIKEVNDSLYSLKYDNDKYLDNAKALSMEQKDFGYTIDKYELGIISKLDMIQKRETLLVTKRLLTESKAHCLISQISLYKAVAGNL